MPYCLEEPKICDVFDPKQTKIFSKKYCKIPNNVQQKWIINGTANSIVTNQG